MARLALPTTVSTGDPFYPNAEFTVAVNGSISGNIFVEVADRSDDLTSAASWDNAHEISFSDTVRQKVFAGSPGYAYRINAANSGSKVTWDYVYKAYFNYNVLD